MAEEKQIEVGTEEETYQACCFHIGGALCGIDIELIQEINKKIDVTNVPLSEEYLMGIMNLRGEIVTIIDLGKKLGLGKTDVDADNRVIILKFEDEFIGLVVGDVSDIITIEKDKVSPPPSNIKGLQGKYFKGVYSDELGVVGLLDVKSVLNSEKVQE